MISRTGAAAGCTKMKHRSSELKTRSIFRKKATKSQEPDITHLAVTTLCVLKAQLWYSKGILCIPNPYSKKKKTVCSFEVQFQNEGFPVISYPPYDAEALSTAF